MATYECKTCGMSVNATCAKCNEPLENDSLKKDDVALDKNIVIQKQKLINLYEELKKEKEKIKKLKTRNATMDAETNELIIDSNAIQFHHLIWMVVGATFAASVIMYSKQN